MAAQIAPLTDAEQARLGAFLKDISARVEAALEAWLPVPTPGADTERLFACMRYSTFAGGKRLRPALLMGAYQAVPHAAPLHEPVHAERAVWAGAAMEMLHTYSLMQDDLPCMDNDDLRRGLPTAHKQFDETTALLASDGLQTGAFELLSDEIVHPDAFVRLKLVRLFAQSAGAQGMVAGQMVDMVWEWHRPDGLNADDLARMNRLKTGLNIEACCEAGAVLAHAGAEVRAALLAYGEALGRAYQIYDDVLDVIGTAEQLGKTPGKDAKAGKGTFATLLGVEGAREQAYAQAQKALDALEKLGPEADMLRLLARFCVVREG